jgi:two-component system response regulator QseB
MAPIPTGAGRPAPSSRTRVLLMEDDTQLSALLGRLLHQEGYLVDVACDGQHGLHLGLTGEYDLLIVDRGLPALEGVEVIRRLRRGGISTPVLVLTAWGTLDDKVEGLDAGAEDYLVKPFEVKELLARLRALLRRHREIADTLPLGSSTLLVHERRVVGSGRDEIDLSARECDLLQALARQPTQIFGREELLDQVFGAADTTGSVDTYVHYLRRKLGRGVVRTVRGRGYRMGST